MVGFATLSSSLIYIAFLRGIYNFREREIINMRHVPFVFKFGVAALIGISIARDNHIK